MDWFESSGLAPSTVQLYTTRIRKWLAIDPTQTIDTVLLFPDVSIRLLVRHLRLREVNENKSDICTPSNVHNYLASVVAVLRHCPQVAPLVPDPKRYLEVWTQIMDTNSQTIRDRRYKQMPTVKQEQRGGSHLTFQQLSQKTLDTDVPLMDRLLLAFYTMIYPVRADYYATEIVYGDQEPQQPNFIRIKNVPTPLSLTIEHRGCSLTLREFKTSKRYGQIHHEELPDALQTLLYASLLHCPRSYLFERSPGIPYTRNKFSQWASARFQDLFGVALNLTIVRHLFISTLSMELPADELKQIGDLMGHSLPMQKLYKWDMGDQKENDEDEEDVDDCV